MKKTALILGGTGLVGSHLIEQLTTNELYDKIIVIARKEKSFTSSKVEVIISDFQSFDFVTQLPKIDSLFSCLGTTSQATPDKQKYLFIELGIPENVIQQLASNNNLPARIHVVSAIGANVSSKNFYMSMKGKLEELIDKTAISQKYFYQPAVILGQRERKERWWEKLTVSLSKGMDKILKGDSIKYHTIEAKQIAAAMIHYDNHPTEKSTNRFLYKDMVEIGD